MRAALGVEVEQIERVILDLLTINRGERCRPDLEFQHQNGVCCHQYRIDPSLQTEQGIFQ